MLSRISEAFGCPRSKECSTDDLSVRGASWLSQSTHEPLLFAKPVPILQEAIRKMGIARCGTSGRFYFSNFLCESQQVVSGERQTPWSVVHTSQQRCKAVEKLLNDSETYSGDIIRELRELATSSDENACNGLATFSDLLVPLLTEKPNDSVLEADDDVLILFGSPATVFQLLLSVKTLTPLMTDLGLELVACSSTHSQRILEQFHPPVGITTMFSSKQAFTDTGSRLLQLFQVISDSHLQASILSILPDLASCPCASSGDILSDVDRSSLVNQLIELLHTVPLGTIGSAEDYPDPVCCLLECLTGFAIDVDRSNQLYDVCFELLDRCYTDETYYVYLPMIIRCLLVNGPTIPRTSELSKFVSRLRRYCVFPKNDVIIPASSNSVDCVLVEMLRLTFQFNSTLVLEWMRAMNTSDVTGLVTSDSELVVLHEQALQDFLILCVIYSALDVNSKAAISVQSQSNTLGGLSRNTFSSSTSDNQTTRVQRETAVVARHLVSSGRLFPAGSRSVTTEQFLVRYASLFMSDRSPLFPAFLYFLDQFVSSFGLSASASNESVRDLGLTLYVGSFCNRLCTVVQQHEIVLHLVRHCMTGLSSLGSLRSSRHVKTNLVTKTGLVALLRLAQLRPLQLFQFESVLYNLLEQLFQSATSLNSASADQSIGEINFRILLDEARCIFTILTWIAFYDRENKSPQEKLLTLLRKKLSNTCLITKALGVVGAVGILETVCRRQPVQEECKNTHLIQVSTQMDESGVVASQAKHIEADRISISTTSTSRTSNTSCLSLRGPGTRLADDPNEIRLPVEDTEDERTDGLVEPRLVTPPSRLLLQIIGLVEHAITPFPQLKTFWLDELRFCSGRLSQMIVVSDQQTVQTATNDVISARSVFSIPSVLQAERLLGWMGARVMRDFRDVFVMDNAAIHGHTTQLNLNDPIMCEIAIGIGPAWSRYLEEFKKHHSRLTKWSSSSTAFSEKSVSVFAPLLVPSQIALLSLIECHQRDDQLDAIDALLGCPILLPTSGNVLSYQHLIGFGPAVDEPLLLLFVINWCIEVVNVFAPSIIAYRGPGAADSSSNNCADVEMTQKSSVLSRQKNALIRLEQIAFLRKQLFDCLASLDTANGVRFESADYCQSASTVCLPTATYEPGKAWDVHPPLPVNTDESKCICFACGIHLGCTNGKNAIKARITSKEGKSKCALTLTEDGNTKIYSGPSKEKKMRSQLEQDVDVCLNTRNNDTEDENNEEESTSCSDATMASVNEDATTEINSRRARQSKQKVSKMAAIKLTHSKTVKSTFVNFEELSVCFRELDMTALALGLCHWPRPTSHPTLVGFQSEPKESSDSDPWNWETLAWLVEDLALKVDHISGMRTSVSAGWYAFQRLDSWKPELRSSLLLQLISPLQRALRTAVDVFSGKPDTSDSIVNSSASSSDESDDNRTQSPPSLPSSKRVKKRPCVDLASRSWGLVTGVICNSLAILNNFCVSEGNLNSVVVPKPLDHRTSTCCRGVSQFTVDCVYRLASACTSQLDSSSNDHTHISDLSCTRNRFRDLMVDSDVTCPTPIPIPSDLRLFVAKLRVILEWLLGMAPDGLPHATAAYLHCRLVYCLTNTYLDFVAKVRDTKDSESSEQFWIPDLFTYSKSLLDVDWDPNVRWKGHSYRGSLQGLLAMHLRIRPDNSANPDHESSSSTMVSSNFLLDFTRNLILPTVRRYQGRSVDRCSSAWNGYRTLTRQTLDIYCREVMETVLWFMKQLRVVEGQTGVMDENHERLLLTNWSECVMTLGLLVELIRSPGLEERNKRRAGGEPCCDQSGRLMLTLLPSIMRTGRLFLQGLLRTAMPLLSNLFRHHVAEVTTFLRNTQSLTRFMQRVCTHAKAYRDSQLTNQIPSTRRCLETFLYRVKILLSQHQCAEAFWLGTLKNRDIHGVELPDDDDDKEDEEEEEEDAVVANHSWNQRQTSSISDRTTRASLLSDRASYSQSLPAGNVDPGSIDSDLDNGCDDECELDDPGLRPGDGQLANGEDSPDKEEDEDSDSVELSDSET
ncbi:Fanconi anemia group D2 protein [Paragonimus heterotremus]|uniref:Fanconi anemia group D2 protein n=1 Tax=Paragonimus heterotremus TaxID=100268 RepID=A0A8J4T4K8_9TREM|nr:Fanconi anemia group D2 protein [Paragonimus heterotremus]